jgi:hypothetical protein
MAVLFWTGALQWGDAAGLDIVCGVCPIAQHHKLQNDRIALLGLYGTALDLNESRRMNGSDSAIKTFAAAYAHLEQRLHSFHPTWKHGEDNDHNQFCSSDL